MNNATIHRQSTTETVIAWLLPGMYLLHLVEEYYVGVTLPAWMSDTFNADLSNTDFIWINSIAFTVVTLNAILFSFGRKNMVFLLALITVFALNGVIHCLSSLFWWEYVPGTATGLVLYIPLGVFCYRKLVPTMSERTRRMGIVMGVLIHAIVIVIAQTV